MDSPMSSLVSSPLEDSPTVVAGSSMDCHCTGTKGEHLIYCVQQATDPAISLHRGVPPRSPEGSGALPKLKECLAMYSRKARTRELRTTAYHGVPQRFRKRSQNGRRPSLPETNSMAGRACVRNVILQTVSLRGSPRPGDNPKPK